MFKGQDEHP